MPLNVTNVSGRPFEVNLSAGGDHGEDYPHTPFSLEQPFVDESGTPGHRLVEKSLPPSVAWGPGESLSGLPESLREVPQFRRAVFAGILRIDPAA